MAIERGPAQPPALRELSTTAIANTLGVSAVDIFVYDTRKDSDGGAWRKRTQNTSWYNETLNTDTRGSRRDFPSVAVIVVTSLAVTIYDGDDPDLPMWMVFQVVGYNSYLGSAGSNQIFTVSMLNGILSVGCFYDLHVIRFIADNTNRYGDTGITTQHQLPISGRNDSSGTWFYGVTTPNIINRQVNDVAMTVLPNAPIDAATGLPIPTIAAATNGGTSIMHNNGTVTHITCNNANYTISRKVDFLSDGALGLSLETSNAGAEDSYYVFNKLPYVNTVITVDSKSGSPISADAFYSAQIVNPANVSLFAVGNQADTNRTLTKSSGLNFATPFGVTQIAENRLNPTSGMVNGISSKYNTGWMHGNIKGAWLSDNTAETVVGTELVTNGTFDTNTSGWSANGSGYHTYSAISGALSVTRGSFGLGGGEPYQAISVTPGKFYRFSFVGASGDMSASVGSTVGGNQYLSWSSTGATTLREGTFQATSNTVYVLFICNNSGTTASVDNVSLRLADADRSVNSKGLQVFGTLTKAAVGTGNDLVGYSGWSASNYLLQPYNSGMDFGTGDFSISVWLKNGLPANNGVIFQRRSSTQTNNQIILDTRTSTGYVAFYTTNNNYSTFDQIFTTVNVCNNVWTHLVAVKTGGRLAIYVNGVLNVSGAVVNSTGSLSVNDATVYVGNSSSGTNAVNGDLALLRVSATAPSADQIAKMYSDERMLFQTGAKACLYGTSDAVTGIAYDDATQLLHVGTSSGRSVFEGLRRVDNTTTAVSTAISASNGLVAEQ